MNEVFDELAKNLNGYLLIALGLGLSAGHNPGLIDAGKALVGAGLFSLQVHPITPANVPAQPKP